MGSTKMTGRPDTERNEADLSDRDGGATSGGLTRRAIAGALALAPFHRRASAEESGRDPSLLDGAKLQAAYRDRPCSPTEGVTSVFKRAEALNPAVNAFIVLDRDGALSAAEASAARWRDGKPRGPPDRLPLPRTAPV